MPRRARIPQAEAGDAIGVDVFRRAFQLRENGQIMARVLGQRVRYFEQYRAIALNDQGAV